MAGPASRASLPRPPPVGSLEATGLHEGVSWGRPLGPLLPPLFCVEAR